MHCLVGAVELQLSGGMGSYPRVLFMGFLQQNTMAMTVVYIHVVLCNEHTGWLVVYLMTLIQ
jgi:hypothetical protein